MDIQQRDVMQQLERICNSGEFRTKPVMQKFLTYLVTQDIEGRSDQISAYSIGVDVFQRGRTFDPATDPHVRISAGRLRGLLRTYYLAEGNSDPIRIDVPKGTYVPNITSSNNRVATAPGTISDTLRPAVAVLPFRNLTGRKELDYLAVGFAQELSDVLTKYDDFRVIGVSRRPDDNQFGAQTQDDIRSKGIGFLIDGDIKASGTRIKTSFRLLDMSDDSRLASDSVKFDANASNLFELQERITLQIAAQFCGEYGHINHKRYQTILQSKPRTLNEQDLLLRYYYYVTVLTPASAVQYQTAALEALTQEPDSALVNAIVGGHYGGLYTLDFPGADEGYEKCGALVEKAYALDPKHQFVKTTLAFKCFVHDERERFFSLLDSGREWLTNSPLRLGAYAMHACFFGEWDLGMELLAEVFDNNVHVPSWLYSAVSFYHYRRRDYHEALRHANKYQFPELFWPHVQRLTALGQLGQKDDAMEEFQKLLRIRPDFVERGRYLLHIYLKEATLLEHTLEGFEKIGVTIA